MFPHVTNLDLETHLRIDDGSDQGQNVALYLDGAVSYVEQHLGYVLTESTSITKFQNFDCPLRIFGVSIKDLLVSYIDIEGNSQELPTSDYYLSQGSNYGRVHLLETAPPLKQHPEPITISYTSGYTSGKLPGAIRSAILLVGAHLYENREETSDLRLMSIPLGVHRLLNQFQITRL